MSLIWKGFLKRQGRGNGCDFNVLARFWKDLSLMLTLKLQKKYNVFRIENEWIRPHEEPWFAFFFWKLNEEQSIQTTFLFWPISAL